MEAISNAQGAGLGAHALSMLNGETEGGDMSLHGEIMNIRCEPEDGERDEVRWKARAIGHRDARHAAADLAVRWEAETAETIARLTRECDEGRAEVERIRADLGATTTKLADAEHHVGQLLSLIDSARRERDEARAERDRIIAEGFAREKMLDEVREEAARASGVASSVGKANGKTIQALYANLSACRQECGSRQDRLDFAQDALVAAERERDRLKDLMAQIRAEGKLVDENYLLPCDVRLPPNMTIGKGCKLSTLLNALRRREGEGVEFTGKRYCNEPCTPENRGPCGFAPYCDPMSERRATTPKESKASRVRDVLS